MRQFTDELIIFTLQAPVSAEFTAAAVTGVITSNAHGLSNGDVVTLANSGGALPAGFTASTYYYVIDSAINTFKISLTPAGAAVVPSDTGSGTHSFYKEVNGRILNVSDYKSVEAIIFADGTPNLTLKCVGSITDECPLFMNPVSASNLYGTVAMIDLQDASAIYGDTGVVFSGSTLCFRTSINVDALKYLTFKTLDFKAGSVTVKVKGFHE